VARVARHPLVRVSAAQSAAETRQFRKVQDVSISIFTVDSVQWVVGGALRHPPPTVLNQLA